MFNNLFVLGFKRTRTQAVGFYIAYVAMFMVCLLVIVPVCAVVIANISGATSVSDAAEAASFWLGAGGAIIVSGVLTYYVLKAKGRQLSGRVSIGYMVLACALAGLFGCLAGMIVPAVLTTVPAGGSRPDVSGTAPKA